MQKDDFISWRHSHNLNQQEMADLIGISRSHLSLIECGKRPISQKIIAKMKQCDASKTSAEAKDASDDKNAQGDVCPICNHPQSHHPVKYQPREVAAYVLDNNEKLQRIDSTISQMSDVLKMVTHLDEFVERKIDAQNDKLFTFIAGICNVLLTELSVTVTILLSESQSNTYAIELINQAKEQVQDLLRFAKSRGH